MYTLVDIEYYNSLGELITMTLSFSNEEMVNVTIPYFINVVEVGLTHIIQDAHIIENEVLVKAPVVHAIRAYSVAEYPKGLCHVTTGVDVSAFNDRNIIIDNSRLNIKKNIVEIENKIEEILQIYNHNNIISEEEKNTLRKVKILLTEKFL